MKRFLIASSSLATVTIACSAGAVDVTLGGSIDMGVEFGLGKEYSNLTLGSATNSITLSISAAHTTDGGLKFGGGFSLGTSATLKFSPYQSTNGSGKVVKYLAQKTNKDRTDILGHAYNVSGGAKVDVADIVSVKINSDWIGIDSDAVQNVVKLETSFTSSAICKVAGRGKNVANGIYAGSPTILGERGAFAAAAGGALSGGKSGVAYSPYLPAGQVLVSGNLQLIAGSMSVKNQMLQVSVIGNPVLNTTKGAAVAVTQGATLAASKHTIKPIAKSGANDTVYAFAHKAAVYFDGPASVGAISGTAGSGPASSSISVPVIIDVQAPDVTSAAVFAGPFMEVAMASSSTKMVVGALCLDGNDPSATMIHMDNASKVMTVSDASIYIEGGFGKLSLQSSDYTGGVTAIAGAGDQADIDADGWVIAAEAYGLMGANPFIAMDLNKGDSLGDIEVITGGTFDLGSLALAFDVALDNPTDVLGISSWDLGATYAMGDLALGFATDSSSDWGLSAAMGIAGFGVSAVFGSSSAGDHQKSGITYVVTATTALNGYNLAIGFDQSLKPALGVDYDLGGLNIYANYDAADEGGSVGATLSF